MRMGVIPFRRSRTIFRIYEKSSFADSLLQQLLPLPLWPWDSQSPSDDLPELRRRTILIRCNTVRASLHWMWLFRSVWAALWRIFSASVGERGASLLLLLHWKQNFECLNYEGKLYSEGDYFIQLPFVLGHLQSVALPTFSHHHVSSWQVDIQ